MAAKRKVSTTVDMTPTSPPKRVTRSSTRAATVSPVAAPVKATRTSTRVQAAKMKQAKLAKQTVTKKPSTASVKPNKARKSLTSTPFGGFSNSAFGTQASSHFGTPFSGFGAAPVSTGFGFGTPPQPQQPCQFSLFGTPSPVIGSAATSSSFGYGKVPTVTAFSLGGPAPSAPPQPQQPTPFTGLGAAPASTGFGFGTAPTSSGFGFGAAPAATGFSFGGGSFVPHQPQQPSPFTEFGTSAFGSSPFGASATPMAQPTTLTSAFNFGTTTQPSPSASSLAATRRLDDVYSRRFGSASTSVVGDYDVMLNQVAITSTTSKNKFYRIQLLNMGNGSWNVYTRWGRVGEDGDEKLLGNTRDFATAEKQFMQKFKDKTKNNWEDRANFVPKKNSYEIVELDGTATATSGVAKRATIGDDSVPSKLAPRTQKLIQMIFDKDMFKNELVRMNLDPQRMPLGTLSLSQIQKGVDILDQLRDALESGNTATATLQTLSAKFYQLIPHAYTRRTIPPVLNTPQDLEAKYEMLATLHDIVVAQDVEKALGESTATPTQHSLDLKYAELHSDLDLVTPTDPLFDVVQT
ncbi:hypothetical protein As57867_003599, partial [Aphanomyces stellatus]